MFGLKPPELTSTLLVEVVSTVEPIFMVSPASLTARKYLVAPVTAGQLASTVVLCGVIVITGQLGLLNVHIATRSPLPEIVRLPLTVSSTGELMSSLVTTPSPSKAKLSSALPNL